MSAGWLARAAFALVFALAAVLIGFADLASLAMVAVGAGAACLIGAGGGVVVCCPCRVGGGGGRVGLGVWFWCGAGGGGVLPGHIVFGAGGVSFALWGVPGGAPGLAGAGAPGGPADTGMPFREVLPLQRAFLIMNPRSGGGKV